MQLIGILRWLVELGRLDVCAEVSMMSLYNAMPCVGHFHAVLRLFGYLETHPSCEIVMDSAYMALTDIPKSEWHEFYPWAKEVLPPDMPEALGRAVKIVVFVDASHASNLVTRQSRTGVLIPLNDEPIVWYSKKQNAVKTSSFGSEFAALKTGVELVEGLVYKLQMMGIPNDGHCHTLVDINSVVINTSRPESDSVAYQHYVCLKCASDLIGVAWEGTKTNLANMLTMIHTGRERARLVEFIMYEEDKIPRVVAIKALNVLFGLPPH
ncbi:unnamed protein product [Cylindrotheca closterium]|uniref:Uncharacterized protein n=1 Tax=Cylindrotheca closterium TaxID=2856 RepID=A0AAD2CF52_9STRA|nr:unnamed protein product [Cylindrotheca closterium]